MRSSVLLIFMLGSFSNLIGQKNIYYYLNDIKSNILTYRIYHLSKRENSEYRFNYHCLLPKDDYSLHLGIKKTQIEFPNKDFIIYSITNNNYEYRKMNNDWMLSVNSAGCGHIPFGGRFLVGYSRKKILYLSGMFFKNSISKYFDLNISKPASFYDFLKIKLYNYGFSSFRFKRKNSNFILFSGFLKGVKKPAKIRVNRKLFDEIEILGKEYNIY